MSLKLAVLRNCVSDKRFNRQKLTGGALLGRKDLGCGLNALAFLSVFSRKQGEFLIKNIKPTGTSFLEIMNFVTSLNGYKTEFKEISVDISNPHKIISFFNELYNQMPENSCTIAKLMRNPNINQRSPKCRNFTIGHSLIFSKEGGKLYTIDPQQGTKRERKQNSDEKVIKSFQNNCYISVKLVGTPIARNIVPVGEYKTDIDGDIVMAFDGKRKSTRRKPYKKSRKRKSTRRKPYKKSRKRKTK